jgi:hypothetical protein
VLVAGLIAVGTSDAMAQPTPGKLDLGAGVQWTGAMALGDMDATETASNGSRFRLFASSTSLEPSTGLEGSVRFQVAPAVEVGVASSFSRARLRSKIASDVEGVPDVEALEDISEFVIAATVLARLNWRPVGRASPFVTVGAGYLRHLHESRLLVETGSVFHLGAGLDYILRAGSGALKATGVRVDGRALFRSNGVAFDDRWRAAPAVGASIFTRF